LKEAPVERLMHVDGCNVLWALHLMMKRKIAFKIKWVLFKIL
jgi:hypothetical protein